MKIISYILLAFVLALGCHAQTTNKTPILRGQLQTPLDANGKSITNAPTPTRADMLANKAYVDSAVGSVADVAYTNRDGQVFKFKQVIDGSLVVTGVVGSVTIGTNDFIRLTNKITAASITGTNGSLILSNAGQVTINFNGGGTITNTGNHSSGSGAQFATNKAGVLVSGHLYSSPGETLLDPATSGNFVAGGSSVTLRDSVTYSAIVGGQNNLISTNVQHGGIFSGYGNVIGRGAAKVSILGGMNNTIGHEDSSDGVSVSSILGGEGNHLHTLGQYSSILGGRSNEVTEAYSFAFGRQARAIHQGVFVHSDSQAANFDSTTADSYIVRAQGGIGLNTNNANGFTLQVGGSVNIATTFSTGSITNRASSGSALQKTDSNKKLIDAVAGTDYQTAGNYEVAGKTSTNNTWEIWADATAYYARNNYKNILWTSADFSTLLTWVSTNIQDAAYIYIAPIPTTPAYRRYIFTSTVTFTNAVIIEGAGNPASIFIADATLNAPMLQFGTTGIAIGGIVRVNKIRFEGSAGGASCAGIKFVNCSEPNVLFCEFNTFAKAGIWIDNLSANIWSQLDHNWFVGSSTTNSHCILVTTPGAFTDNSNTELQITDNLFSAGHSHGVTISNDFRNIQIIGNRFLANAAGQHYRAIQAFDGYNFNVSQNIFRNFSSSSTASPVLFGARAALTNINLVASGNFINNVNEFNSSPTNIFDIGANISGVVMIGNFNPRGNAASGLTANMVSIDYSNSFFPRTISSEGATNRSLTASKPIRTDSSGGEVSGDTPLGTDTTGNYAAGDAEAGAALTGDSATSFFSTGTLEDGRLSANVALKDAQNNFSASNFFGGSFNTLFNGGIIISSNSWTVGATLRNGENRLVSSNGVFYVIAKAPNGDLSTNALGGAGGGGDMVLASVQTVTGAKTFNTGKLIAQSNLIFGSSSQLALESINVLALKNGLDPQEWRIYTDDDPGNETFASQIWTDDVFQIASISRGGSTITPSHLLLGGYNNTDGVLGTKTILQGNNAFNDNAGDITIIAAGIGSRSFVVADFSTAVGGFITLTINGANTDLVEGADYDAETSNDVTATNIANAINQVAGVTAAAVTATVYVKAAVGTVTIKLASDTDPGGVEVVEVASGKVQITGETFGGDAVAGYVGEYMSSLVAVGAAAALTTATALNVTSLALPAGDWDVEGNINFVGTTATRTITSGGISTTSATVPTDGTEVFSGVQTTILSSTDGITLARKRVNVSTTTTVYLVGKSTFSAGTVTAYGSISARRAR